MPNRAITHPAIPETTMFDHHLKHPERIINLPDKDFFSDLDLDSIGDEALGTAVREQRYEDAYTALWDYLRNRSHITHPFSQTREQILNRVPRNQKLADHILKGKSFRIDHITYDFSKTLDFNSPTGVSTKHGFHYLAWMDCLIHAAVEHEETGYLDSYLKLFNEWYEQRESITRARESNDVIFYELGIVARNVRFLNFLYATLYLDAGDRIGPRDIERLLKTFLGGARWLVLEQEEKGYRNGNWQVFAVWYLLQFGILFPEFKESAQFRKIGSTYLEEHMGNDFYDDGGHSERCFSYGLTIVNQLNELLQFVEQNPGVETPIRFGWKEKMAPMFEWYLKTTAPGPEFPGFNDGEFMRREHFFPMAANLFEDNRYLWPIRHKTPEWEQSAIEPEYQSVLLPSSEFCVLRDGFAPEDSYMLLNFGGFPGGHTHQDLLDFTLYAKGVPLAADVARFNGYDQPWDLYFRSPQAHNQVTVEGAEMERSKVRGEAIQFGTSPYLDTFSGIHRAYYDTAGVVMERRVFFIKSMGFLICDTAAKVNIEPSKALYKTARNSYLWHLHSPYPFHIHEDRARAESEGVGLLVLPANKRWLSHAYTAPDYLEENTREFPHWKGREDPILWPERYFLNLRAWYTDHHATLIDVFLMPYEGEQPTVELNSLPATVEGTPPAHIHPRALEVVCGEAEPGWIILISHPDATLAFPGGTFRGHSAAIRVENGKFTGVFLQDAAMLQLEGHDISESMLHSSWIDLN